MVIYKHIQKLNRNIYLTNISTCMASLIKDPVILNYVDLSKEVVEKHRNTLIDYYNLFRRSPSTKGKMKIHDRYSILWDDVRYEIEDYHITLSGETLKYIELYRRDYTKHSIQYFNKNNEVITQILWWPNGIVKSVTSFDGEMYCESSCHKTGKLDYTYSYRINKLDNILYLKFI